MAQRLEEIPTWITKLNETTVVTMDVKGTTWKVWCTVTEEPMAQRSTLPSYRFNFIVHQCSGPRNHMQVSMRVGNEHRIYYERTLKYGQYSPAEEYSISARLHHDNQFVISCGISAEERWEAVYRRIGGGEAYKLSAGDKIIEVGEKTWPISEKLKKIVGDGREVQLNGVDYEDVRALINDPSLGHVDITVDKCQSFAGIERRYGIKCHSEKAREMLEMDFWSNTDKMDGKIMCEKKHSVTAPEIRIYKKFHVPSLPNKFTINAFDMNFDVYLYIQEYNGTSYISIGIISDKSTDNESWSSSISLNIQLHHRQNPELDRSADISRDFNNYQRSAGCPTFMLSNELGDYCQRDGSYIITISLSPTIITNIIQYPGIKDVMVCSANKKIMVSRDLLLHYCGYFKALSITDKLSADLFPAESLKMLLDLIYHRSTGLTITNIQKLLNLSEMIMCPYAHNFCDRLLANQYYKKLLSINRTKEFLDGWDLTELREAEKIMNYVEKEKKEQTYVQQNAFNVILPLNATVRVSMNYQQLLEKLLPLELFEDEMEREKELKEFHLAYAKPQLDDYKQALHTLEGVPRRLRSDVSTTLEEAYSYQKVTGIIKRLERYVTACGRGGYKTLHSRAIQQKELVTNAIEELKLMRSNGAYGPGEWIGVILARHEENADRGRRMAMEMFMREIRRKDKNKDVNYEVIGGSLDRLRDWVEYLGV